MTHYRTLERRDGNALIECRLETGRRNQIRVHMAELGCPVVGDRKYGHRPRRGERPRRVLLHSWRLSFRHPITGRPIEVRIDPVEPELRPGMS